jgi:hypothetical protein
MTIFVIDEHRAAIHPALDNVERTAGYFQSGATRHERQAMTW